MTAIIVGTGRMGAIHAASLRENGFSDVIGFDLIEASRQNFTRETNFQTKPMSDFTAFASSEEVELAVISTTTPSKARLVRHLLETSNSSTIFVEKPFSDSLSGSRELIELAGDKGIKLVVNHQIMFTEIMKAISSHRGMNDVGPFVSLMVSGANFGLANKAAHYFDAFRVLAGNPLTTIFARLEDTPVTSHRGSQFSDFSGFLQGWSEDGQSLSIDFSRANRLGICFILNYAFGKYVVNEISGDITFVEYTATDFPEVMPYNSRQNYSTLGKFPNDILRSTKDLYSSVLGGGYHPGSTAIDHAMASTVASIESSRRGEPVRLSELEKLAISAESFGWS